MDELQGFKSTNMFHEGVLYIKEEPLYIVEYYDDGEPNVYISVFDVGEASRRKGASVEAKLFPRKAYERRKVKRGFAGNTLLSELAEREHETETFIREVDKPPVFVAPLEQGIDTFHGNEGIGFYERTKDRFVKREGKIAIEGGNRTGVFIALVNIDWRKSSIPTNDVIESYQSRKSLWRQFL